MMTEQEIEKSILQEKINKMNNFIDNLSHDSKSIFDEHILPHLLLRIRKILNKRISQQSLMYSDDMPNNFNTFDTIAVLYQSMYIDEMLPIGCLSDYIHNIIDEEIKKSSPMEREIMYNSYISFSHNNEPEYDIDSLCSDIYNEFCIYIDEHSKTIKIQKILDRL